MTDTHIVSPYRVWVMDPAGTAADGYTFPWAWSRWRLEPRLIAKSYGPMAGAMGKATFRVLRKWRQDETDAIYRLHSPDRVIPRAWVAITNYGDADTIDDGTLDEDAVVWWGFLGDPPDELVESEDDELGSMEAMEVGHLLDNVAIEGWSRSSPGGYPIVIRSPPTANLCIKDGHVIGNAKRLSGAGYNYYVFAQLPEDCGTASTQYWSRWRLLLSMLATCSPAALPKINAVAGNATFDAGDVVSAALTSPPGGESAGDQYLVNAPATGAWATHENQLATWSGTDWTFTDPDAGADIRESSTGDHYSRLDDGSWSSNDLTDYLDDITTPEVFDFQNVKWRGALDILFPFSHSLDWKITIGRTEWTLSVYMASDGSDYGLPAPVVRNIDLTGAEGVAVNLKPALADQPDEVVFEGGRCFFGFSISYLNSNADKYWQTDTQTDYDAATDEERLHPQYEDVYTLFRLKPDADGDLRRSNNPGDSATNDGPLFPEVIWNGTVAHLGTLSQCPYLPDAHVANFIPWEAGRQSDGTDTRDATRKAQPAYMHPKVFYYDADIDPHWADLTQTYISNQFTQKQPQISSDDRASALRVRFTPPQTLALGEFTGEGEQPEVDWKKLILTIGMESDQRVRVVKRRQVNGGDLPDASVRTRLTVRDDSLVFWCTLKGTVLAVREDAGDKVADRVSADNETGHIGYIIRNDFPKAERNANRLAAWAFRPRMSGTIELAAPDLMPIWLDVGSMIGTLTEPLAHGQADADQVVRTVNGVIRGYQVTLEEDRARVVVTIDNPPAPEFARGVTVSPSSGGQVSPSLGGTVPQAVQRIQRDMRQLQSESQRRIIIPPLERVSNKLVVKIIDGNLSGDTASILYYATDPTLSALYDPDVDTSYPTGLGRAWLMDESGQQLQRVLVRHDFSGAQAPLVAGWVYKVRGTRYLTVASGPDAGRTMLVYLVTWDI